MHPISGEIGFGDTRRRCADPDVIGQGRIEQAFRSRHAIDGRRGIGNDRLARFPNRVEVRAESKTLSKDGWANRVNYAAIGIHPTSDTEMSMFLTGGRRDTLRLDGFVSVNAPLATPRESAPRN